MKFAGQLNIRCDNYMKYCVQTFISIVFILILGASSFAENDQHPTKSEEVVLQSFMYLEAGKINSLDSLFLRIPIMENRENGWLIFLKKLSDKTIKEQISTEVVLGCGKELEETAVVLINKTMKQGKPVRDPDFLLLVKKQDKWLLLPDGWHKNLREEVRMALSEKQIEERNRLTTWIREISRYGVGRLTWIEGENGGYSAKCNQP